MNKNKEQENILAHRFSNDKKKLSKEEKEAEYFAICLLLPRERFLEVYNELNKTSFNKEEIISLLSFYFKVPNEIVKKRLKELVG